MLGLHAFGDVEDDGADADDFPVDPHRMVVGEPVPHPLWRGSIREAQVDVADGLSPEGLAVDGFHPGPQCGCDVGHRATEVIGDRQTVHACECFVDPQHTQVPVDQREADGRGSLDRAQQRQVLVGVALPAPRRELQVLPVVDVVGGTDPQADVPTTVPDGQCTEAVPSVLTVGATDPVVQCVRRGGSGGTGPGLRRPFDVVGMYQVDPLAVVVRLARSAGVVDAPAVDVARRTVGRRRPHEMWNRLDDAVEHRVPIRLSVICATAHTDIPQ